MRAIKFRYIWRRKGDGHIYVNIVPIECLEGAGDTPFVHMVKLNLWEMVARSQWTELLDKNGVEIYEGDITDVGLERYRRIIEWVPAYAGFGLRWVDSVKHNLHGNQGGLSQKWIDEVELVVIGTIHQNPELLQN